MPAEFFYGDTDATVFYAGYNEFASTAGANKNSPVRPGGGRVGPVTHDDDSSYVQGPTGAVQWRYQSFRLDWPGPIGAVSSVTLGARHRHGAGTGNTAWGCAFLSAAGVAAANAVGGQDGVLTYATSGPTLASPPGGGAWTPAHIGATVTGAYVSTYPSGSGEARRFTSIWGVLTYTPPAGGFVFLLGLAGLAALPLVGVLVDRPQFATHLAWRQAYHPRHTILTGDEADQAWREYREYRHPRFFLPSRAPR